MKAEKFYGIMGVVMIISSLLILASLVIFFPTILMAMTLMVCVIGIGYVGYISGIEYYRCEVELEEKE